MMELLNDVFIRCGRCGHTFGLHKEDLDIECNVYDRGENSMCEEAEYRIEGYTECPECGHEISFRISGFEYPVGAYNYEDNEIDGGKFDEEPQMAVVYSEDEFDSYEAYQEYDRIQPLILDIARNPELIYNISSREFEEVIERLFQEEGFETELTPEQKTVDETLLLPNMKWASQLFFILNVRGTGGKTASASTLFGHYSEFKRLIR